MGLAATVYAESLYPHNHGHPMWSPEPSKGLDGCAREIQLGDVGYLTTRGGFRRLFNITVDAQHELNAGGVPEGFIPVVFNTALVCRDEDALNPGELCSEGVERVAIEGSAGVTVAPYAGLETSYHFKCKTHRGAFLHMKDFTTEDWIEPNSQFTEYMRRHHDKWYTFVTDPQILGLDCMPEDIILVRGTMKTSSWTVGVFPAEKDHSHAFSGRGEVMSAGKARVRVETARRETHKCVQRSGPRPQTTSSSRPSIAEPGADDSDVNEDVTPRRNQCIFLSYYKIKYRNLKLLPRKIEAHADPPHLDKDKNAGASSAVLSTDVKLETEYILPRSPLDDLLDYILESSNADAAIASDADIMFLYQKGPIPRDLSAALRSRKPRILVDDFHTGQLDMSDRKDHLPRALTLLPSIPSDIQESTNFPASNMASVSSLLGSLVDTSTTFLSSLPHTAVNFWSSLARSASTSLQPPVTVQTRPREHSDFQLYEYRIIPACNWQSKLVSGRQRQEPWMMHSPIVFDISCIDALNDRFASLQDGDDIVFEDCGHSVSIVLAWLGYPPMSRQVSTQDSQIPPRPITQAKLAKKVAEFINDFIKDMKYIPMNKAGDSQYLIGRNHIGIEDVILHRLDIVSANTWQVRMRARQVVRENIPPFQLTGLLVEQEIKARSAAQRNR